MIAPVFAVALALALPSLAASPSQRPRSLQEVIDLAMAEGKQEVMQPEAAEMSGLPAKEQPLRKLRYKQSACPDKKEHTFAVLYETGPDGKDEPKQLMLSIGSGTKTDGVVRADAVVYLAELKGGLIRAYHRYGTADAMQSDKLPANKKTRLGLKSEIGFHTRLAFALNLQPTK